MKISQRVFELLRGHEIMTDGQTDKVITIDYQTSSGGALIKENASALMTNPRSFPNPTSFSKVPTSFKITKSIVAD